MVSNDVRLIEIAFPLKQASLDSVHEKNVRHGHISTLHIWPARRPLAAARAAILATLLPDPGDSKERRKLCDSIGGMVVKSVNPDQRATEKTEGGILRWLGREPKGNKKKKEAFDALVEQRERKLANFRQQILEANGNLPPKVYDPFSGGGAIPLEAMRLGCEAYANDLNPVSVFLLNATLKYPQLIGDDKLPLPDFILDDPVFMEEYSEVYPNAKKNQPLSLLENKTLDVGLAWHVRAWGRWVLREAKKRFAKHYPAYAAYAPLDPSAPFEPKEDVLVPLDKNGEPDIEALNRDFGETYLQDEKNPRWILRPTVAYLWARTATCTNPECRKTVLLLKTKWLCKNKSGKRAILECQTDNGEISFKAINDVPVPKGSDKEKKESDQKLGKGFMSRTGARCPYCNNILSMDDLKRQGKTGQIGAMPTAVVFEGKNGKEYRAIRPEELEAARISPEEIEEIFKDVPFGIPEEKIVEDAKRNTWCVHYGLNEFNDLFTSRQLAALGTLVSVTRKAFVELENEKYGYDEKWREAIAAYLTIVFDKIADYNSSICSWHNSREIIGHTFARFALPMMWDFVESVWLNDVGGAYLSQLDWVCRYIDSACQSLKYSSNVEISQRSATEDTHQQFSAIITDPPYYDAIGYSVLMDFFYVWLKRLTHDTLLAKDLFAKELAPKWDHAKEDGELIDDASRHGNDRETSKKAYEDGMAKVFQTCHDNLADNGRFVVVFAHKNPDAWETLASAIIRSGFMVTASWPIQTEMGNRMRGLSSAALSSSVWLVCKKRPASARPGWDNMVLAEMEENITEKLREFWDAGIRGPDFVWAATGPALAAYSSHPIVKKTSVQGESLGVNEFLSHVRKMVVNFVVGRLLANNTLSDSEEEHMDGVTAYYLLHRNDFGMEEAPAGACILYATACGLTDRDLEVGYRILKRKGSSANEEDDDEIEDDTSAVSGGKMALVSWSSRKHQSLGLEAPGGGEVPLIDRLHKLMHLWKAGDVAKVDAYIDSFALRGSEIFKQLLQALTELSQNSERNLLESISNHLNGKGLKQRQMVSIDLEK